MLSEFYRRAQFGDKLLHKTVLVKRSENSLKIGTVTQEDFRRITIVYDGEEHRYDKYVACKNSAIYVLEKTELGIFEL